MARKTTKGYEAGLGAGGIFREYKARLKADAEQSVRKMDVHLALPLAHYLNMAAARKDIPEDEQVYFDRAHRMAKQAWDEFGLLLGEVKSEAVRHEMTCAIEMLCAGMAEMGRFMPPSAMVQEAVLGERRKAISSKGGRGRATQRAQEAEETWMPHALELARESRQEKPGGSLDDVAKYILEGWRLRIECPSHGHLRNTVSGWIKAKVLPDKVRRRKLSLSY